MTPVEAVQALVDENTELKKQLGEFKRYAYTPQRVILGATTSGPDRPNRHKLTEQEVKDIRDAYQSGMRQRDLAENYGVNPATISRIVRGIYH